MHVPYSRQGALIFAFICNPTKVYIHPAQPSPQLCVQPVNQPAIRKLPLYINNNNNVHGTKLTFEHVFRHQTSQMQRNMNISAQAWWRETLPSPHTRVLHLENIIENISYILGLGTIISISRIAQND